jgi:hypothetical protein
MAFVAEAHGEDRRDQKYAENQLKAERTKRHDKPLMTTLGPISDYCGATFEIHEADSACP